MHILPHPCSLSLSLSLPRARLPVCCVLAGETPPILTALVPVEYYTSGTELRAAMRRSPSPSKSVMQKGLFNLSERG